LAVSVSRLEPERRFEAVIGAGNAIGSKSKTMMAGL
jgi:hypothetical protein